MFAQKNFLKFFVNEFHWPGQDKNGLKPELEELCELAKI